MPSVFVRLLFGERNYSCCRMCSACAVGEVLEVVCANSKRPAVEPISSEELLFLSLLPQ